MERLFIKAGMLLDCTGRDIWRNKSVYVEDGKIIRIGDINDVVPEGAVVYDFSDRTVMPGLMNAHAHIHAFYPYNDMSNPDVFSFEIVERTLHCVKILNAFLQSGVTYVRSMGARESLDIRIKRAMSKGLVEKIGLITSGPYITMTGGHGYQSGMEVDGPDECRKAVRTILKCGSDMLKVMATGGILSEGTEVGRPQLGYEELKAVVEEAHKANRKVATHAQGMVGIRNAVMAKVDSVEHGCIMSDEIVSMMKEQGTFLVPTLCATHTILENASSGIIPAFGVRKASLVREQHSMWVRRAYEAGVRIAAGTDSSTPFNPPENTWLEIKLLQDCGLSPMDSVLTATKNCAELFGVEELYGTLEEGKMADIIVVKDNPLERVETLSEVLKVFKEGKEIK